MASFDELMDAMEPPTKAADAAKAVDLILTAEDIPNNERQALVTGYLLGITYAGGKYQERSSSDILGEVMERSLWLENS